MCGNRDDLRRGMPLKVQQREIVAQLACAMVIGCQVVPAGLEACLTRFNEQLSCSELSSGDGAFVEFGGSMLEVENAVRDAIEAVPEIQGVLNNEDPHQFCTNLGVPKYPDSATGEELVEAILEELVEIVLHALESKADFEAAF